MSFARFAAIGLAASMLWCGSAAASGPYRSFKLGLWSGGAYTDDRTGGFTHCSAGVAYDSGINVFVLVTGGYRWWLGFINPDWALTPNARMPVALRLDPGPRLAMQGTVPSRQVVLVPLPENSRTIGSFRRSSQLNLTVEGRSFSFKLGGTPAVMAGLEGCVRTSLALEARASRAAPQAAAAAAPEMPARPGAASAPAAATPETPTSASAKPAAPETSAPAPAEPAAPPEKAASSAAAASAAPETPAAWPPAATPSLAAVSGDTSASPDAAPPSTAAALPAAPPAAPEPPAADRAAVSAALEPPAPGAALPAPPFSPQPSAPQLSAVRPSSPATGIELEELGLAKDFFETAQLPNAHLAIADKPAALASFSAVWRSDNAAGAVKIIPPGPDVTGIGIASNLIAVDPQMCKGNFASARSSARMGDNVVVSAVLSCTEAAEERTAEYFITSRHDGGFVVFAVVGTAPAGIGAAADQQRTESLQKAAVRAAGAHG